MFETVSWQMTKRFIVEVSQTVCDLLTINNFYHLASGQALSF